MCWFIVIIENEYNCNIYLKKLILSMYNSLRVYLSEKQFVLFGVYVRAVLYRLLKLLWGLFEKINFFLGHSFERWLVDKIPWYSV